MKISELVQVYDEDSFIEWLKKNHKIEYSNIEGKEMFYKKIYYTFEVDMAIEAHNEDEDNEDIEHHHNEVINELMMKALAAYYTCN